ncbi:hypothetical protein CPB86DRAFT_814259 [Serendipita vermifera]|nr:hypothetical protein CPB86DRAFT_814259 [Serendipita vermifera]
MNNIAATGERRYDPALDDDGGGLGQQSTYEFSKEGTIGSFNRSGLVELGGSAAQQYHYQLPFGSLQLQAYRVALPVPPLPLLSSSNLFHPNISVSPTQNNDSTLYDSSFSSLYPSAMTFPSSYVNNNTDFFAPFHASQTSTYDQPPGYSPLVSSGSQPTTYPDLQHHHQFVSSPRHLEDACYPPSTYTIVAPRFSSYQTPYSPETNTQTSYSAPLRFLSPLQTSSSVNFPYTSFRKRRGGHDPTEAPESSRRFHNHRQLDDFIDVQPSQALTMSLGFGTGSIESSEDTSRIDPPIHPTSQSSSSSLWSVTDASANENVKRRNRLHLALGDIPPGSIPWHVENPDDVSEQRAVRDKAGTIIREDVFTPLLRMNIDWTGFKRLPYLISRVTGRDAAAWEFRESVPRGLLDLMESPGTPLW